MFPRTISRGKIHGESVRRFRQPRAAVLLRRFHIISAANLCVNPSANLAVTPRSLLRLLQRSQAILLHMERYL